MGWGRCCWWSECSIKWSMPCRHVNYLASFPGLCHLILQFMLTTRKQGSCFQSYPDWAIPVYHDLGINIIITSLVSTLVEDHSSCAQSILPHAGNKGFRCYEVKIEESEKAGTRRESNPGHTPLTWATSALPLSYGNRITTSPHNPLYVLHRWYEMPQSHTWQPPSMCRQNSVSLERIFRSTGKFSPSGKNPCWVVFSL